MAVKDEAFQALVQPIAAAGYELVEVTYAKQYGSMTLTLFIDTEKEGGITLDDCELVSKLADPILDELDPTSGAAYTFNVSSLGIDRPIRTQRDFQRKQGTLVEASLYAPKDGVKKVQGTLKGWTDEAVTLEVKGKDVTLLHKEVSVIKPVIEF